jgi:hypothetical protein
VSKFGLGADQALESELVTGTGETLITNQQTNQDLYWALSGGGGGTYGVVSSLTIKVYPDLTSSAATLSSASRGADGDACWDAVETWQRSLPTITYNGCFANWTKSTRGFQFVPLAKREQRLRVVTERMYAKSRQGNMLVLRQSFTLASIYSSYLQIVLTYDKPGLPPGHFLGTLSVPSRW